MKTIDNLELQFTNPLVAVVTGVLDEFNIMPVTSVGMMSSAPFIFTIAIRESRKTRELIDKYMTLVLSFPRAYQISKIDYCGMVSGYKTIKQDTVHFRMEQIDNFQTPIISDAAVNLICNVKSSVQLEGWNIYSLLAKKVYKNDVFDGSLVHYNPVTGEYLFKDKMISKASKASDFFQEKITITATNGDIEEIKRLFNEYTEMLNIDLSFQNFDEEFKNPFKKYGGSDGRIFIAKIENEIVGCCAMHRYDSSRCEMKRLYVMPKYRGKGIGRALVLKTIEDATQIGYTQILLDTQTTLDDSVRLYRNLGFTQIEAYYNNPYPNVVYFPLAL